MTAEQEWLTCAHCGEPVIGALLTPDQFESPEDMAAAGPILHPDCAREAAEFSPTVGTAGYVISTLGPTRTMASQNSMSSATGTPTTHSVSAVLRLTRFNWRSVCSLSGI